VKNELYSTNLTIDESLSAILTFLRTRSNDSSEFLLPDTKYKNRTGKNFAAKKISTGRKMSRSQSSSSLTTDRSRDQSIRSRDFDEEAANCPDPSLSSENRGGAILTVFELEPSPSVGHLSPNEHVFLISSLGLSLLKLEGLLDQALGLFSKRLTPDSGFRARVWAWSSPNRDAPLSFLDMFKTKHFSASVSCVAAVFMRC